MNSSKTYTALFLTSALYAPLLTWWKHQDPIGYKNNSWVSAVVGVGYVLLYLRLLLDLDTWLKLCTGFFVASLPLISRCLLQEAHHNQQCLQFNGGQKK